MAQDTENTTIIQFTWDKVHIWFGIFWLCIGDGEDAVTALFGMEMAISEQFTDCDIVCWGHTIHSRLLYLQTL